MINFDVLLLVATYLGLFYLSGEKLNFFFFHYVLSLIILFALESTLINSYASLLCLLSECHNFHFQLMWCTSISKIYLLVYCFLIHYYNFCLLMKDFSAFTFLIMDVTWILYSCFFCYFSWAFFLPFCVSQVFLLFYFIFYWLLPIRLYF